MNLQYLQDLIDSPAALYSGLAGAAGCLAGWLVGWAHARHQEGRSGPREAAGDRETETRDLRKTLFLLQNENAKLSTFLMTMPDLARRLNSHQERRRTPQLLISFVDGLFDAEQVLVFLTTEGGAHLELAAAKGLSPGLRRAEPIPFGQGRIGWVAEHQITMDENDFDLKSRAMRGALSRDIHPAFRTDLCAPMVMSAPDAPKDRTLGVVSIGGLRGRPKNEKNMLKMVADLGSIAIENTRLVNVIQRSADTDGLTKLANKRHFLVRLGDEINRGEKQPVLFSLFIFDIDHFKTYNDTNGHLAGDEALKVTGRLLKETLREEDFPARYGGEEFVVLLPGTDKTAAAAAAEKVRKAIETFPYAHKASQPGGALTISGGISTYPEDAQDSANLIRCADQALYQGKRAGRNRVCLYQTKFFSDETGAVDLRGIAGLQKG